MGLNTPLWLKVATRGRCWLNTCKYSLQILLSCGEVTVVTRGGDCCDKARGLL